MTVYNILVALASVCIYQLRSEQVLVIKRKQNIHIFSEVLSGKLSLPKPSLCHGTLLLAGQPDQAGGEHQLHHLHRHQVAS